VIWYTQQVTTPTSSPNARRCTLVPDQNPTRYHDMIIKSGAS